MKPKEPRSLYMGLLGPGERKTITIDAPLGAEQQPMLITAGRDQALITTCSIGSVEIEILSKWHSSTAYALAIVPKTAIRVATAVGDIVAKLKG